MATDNLQALFGGTMLPQDMQQELINQRAQQFAQLTPSQQLGSMGYKAGAALGGGLAQAMGVDITDPRIKRQSELQALSQGITPNAEGLAQLATRLAERGFQTEAAQAYQKSAELRKIEAETTSKTMERLTPEQKNAAGIADASGNARGTQEWTDMYKTELSRLTAGSKGANIKEIGVAEGTRQPVYFDAGTDTQFVMRSNPQTGKQERVPFNGGVDRTTARTNVDARNMGETAFSKELGTLDAKKVSEAATAKGAAIDQLKTLQKMAEVDQRPVISGTLADQRTDVSNFFNTIGLSSSKDKVKTANSQEYIKYSTGLVLDNLKKTGYNPSNADMKVVQSIIPRLETDPMARKELIKFMAEKANEVVTESTNLDTFARANKGLSGYTPKIPQVSFGATAPNAAAGLTDAQLKAIAGIK